MAKLIDLDGLAYFYSKIKAMLADKLGKNDVATVATSGSYNDLSDKPTIPSAYTLPTASSTVLGGVKVGNNISVSDGTISLNKSNVTSALGYTPPTSDTVYDNATTTTAGLMSASDKVKLNNIADNANNYIHPSTHPTSMITGLADVATSGSYNDLTDKPNIPASITIDSELSTTSTNPVQNKVVKSAIDAVTASIPTKVSTLQNDAGYLTQHQSLDGYVKNDVENNWAAQQAFKQVKLEYEKYLAPEVSGTSNTPKLSVMHYIATGAFTLDLSSLVSKLEIRESSVFTAYITSSADYPLTITNAGTIKYIGSASDVAITSAGLLLNILMMKDESATVTSIVQASKLS